MDPRLGDDPLAPTELAVPVRNRYFYGKLLDVAHLELEQHYLNSKRWLLNRLISGTGVVCGLRVSSSTNGTRIVIDPGVAIDAWGREIIVPALSLPIDPRALTDDDGRPAGTLDGAGAVTISLCYQECGVDPTPVMIASCKPEGDCAASGTREQYCVVVKAADAAPPSLTCTFENLFEPAQGEQEPADLQTLLAERVSAPCLLPEGKGCVLLATVTLPAEGGLTDGSIDNSVRQVVASQQMLLDLIVCLIGQVRQLTQPGPTPTPTPTPSPTPTPTPTPAPGPTPTPVGPHVESHAGVRQPAKTTPASKPTPTSPPAKPRRPRQG